MKTFLMKGQDHNKNSCRLIVVGICSLVLCKLVEIMYTIQFGISYIVALTATMQSLETPLAAP
jgi:hypothetical protein